MKKPQKTKNTRKNKGTKALSGATVKVTSTPANHQAEIANNDGTIDTKSPKVFTPTEFNAFKWFVFRNGNQFQRLKPNATLISLAFDFDLNVFKGADAQEENLGTQSIELMEKIYKLHPHTEMEQPKAAICKQFNSAADAKTRLEIIDALTDPKLKDFAQQMFSFFENYCISNPGVKRGFFHLVNYQQANYCLSVFQEMHALTTRQEKGINSSRSQIRVSHEDFPTLISAADAEMNKTVKSFFDALSEVLPKDSIVFNQPQKQTVGGWRFWHSSQNNTYAATLFAKATDELLANAIIEALELAFNSVGIKAKKNFHAVNKTPLIVVAFQTQQLKTVDLDKFKQHLATVLETYKGNIETTKNI